MILCRLMKLYDNAPTRCWKCKKTRRFFLPYVLDVWQDENILDTDPYADTVLNVDIQMKIEAI